MKAVPKLGLLSMVASMLSVQLVSGVMTGSAPRSLMRRAQLGRSPNTINSQPAQWEVGAAENTNSVPDSTEVLIDGGVTEVGDQTTRATGFALISKNGDYHNLDDKSDKLEGNSNKFDDKVDDILDTAPACAVDSDTCLKQAPSWNSMFAACHKYKKFCTSWRKDMHRCCSQTCKVKPVCTVQACNKLGGKGSCQYPNAALVTAVYRGCYINKGDDRKNGHLSRKTFGECHQAATADGKAFFGLEDPGMYQTQGEALCLTLSVLPGMARTFDSDCDEEGLYHGYRLGGNRRIALYGPRINNYGPQLPLQYCSDNWASQYVARTQIGLSACKQQCDESESCRAISFSTRNGNKCVICDTVALSPHEAALQHLGWSGCTSSSKCSQCQGDCDNDGDCDAGLYCFQRDSQVVPGCAAGGDGAKHKSDYCTQAWGTYIKKTITAIFVPPEVNKSADGNCRTWGWELPRLATTAILSSDSIAECKSQCAERSFCVAIEYRPGNISSERCEIHTETIAHVLDQGDGAQCWKKEVQSSSFPTCSGTNCVECRGNQCTKCGNGRYLTSFGECLRRCPPGDYQYSSDPANLVCARCNGEVTRDETSGSSSCAGCPDGHIHQPGNDKCQNIQNTCNEDQCVPCARCLEKARPHVQQCIESKNMTTNCVDLDEVWCHTFWGELNDCEGYSMGCFYKLMCHNPCVCEEWKTQIRCGGDWSGSPEQCNATSAMLLNKADTTSNLRELVLSSKSLTSAMLTRSEGAQDDSNQLRTTDDALTGKRCHR